ncbi:hypothetical protein F6X68_11945 [Micromonospora sp. AMSO12t]|uniref:hypothetical protein n=1 Tax=Micromonospora sp. AMSO12t TaxID=2650410 RepID=UPI00124AFA31|nr:hypothetical protein [Micromonospora sp. AMSO12t]KAB1156371.1 hypothetical protein F6X68_11945 [Micromonospora sp. AMSO12t]
MRIRPWQSKVEGVQIWDPLKEHQLLLLRRIGDGDDLSGPDGLDQRHSARALQTRRLVDISRRSGVWRAQITDAGRFYLDNGIHPDHPDRLSPARATPRQRTRTAITSNRSGLASSRSPAGGGATSADSPQPPPTATVEQARLLVERLRAEGGTVRVESPDSEERALYRRVIHAAKQHGLVPAGFHIKHTGRAAGDLIIRLSNDDDPNDRDWNRIRLNTRRVTTDPGLVFAALEKNPAGLEVTKESVPRALDLIRGLAAEARRRGHRVGVNTKTKNPSVYLQVDKIRRRVRLIEEYDEIPHVPTEQEARQLRRNRWMMLPKADRVASGRLRMEIARAGWDKKDTWADDKRTTLEKRLPRIIRDVEAGIAADEEAKQAAQRAHDEYVAELNRREAEERRRWQAAIDEARPQAAELLRKKAFRRAYDSWISANEIRAFCDALEHAAPDQLADSGNHTRWIDWARAAADRLDPTQGERTLAEIGFDIEPKPGDLRPFIGDWSPTEPRREYRSERDQQAIDATRLQADAWHHGMRGRATWWRK